MKHILRSQKLTSAFDVQMIAPGLSGGMMLGTIHKVLALRCDKVRPLLLLRKHN